MKILKEKIHQNPKLLKHLADIDSVPEGGLIHIKGLTGSSRAVYLHHIID